MTDFAEPGGFYRGIDGVDGWHAARGLHRARSEVLFGPAPPVVQSQAVASLVSAPRELLHLDRKARLAEIAV